MVLLTIDNGMRAAELAGLQWVHIRGNYIKVALKMREKYIPISDERRRALLKLRENSDSEYVFVNNRGDPLTPNGVYQVFRRLMDKAGIAGPKLGPHRVRHAIARGMIMQGADMATVQYTLGHSSISSTRVYTQLTPPDVIKKHARYSMAKVVASPLQGAMFEDEVVEAAEAIIAARRSGDNG